MVSNKNIDDMIKTLKKEVSKMETPSVTLIKKETKDPFRVLISCIISLRTKDDVTIVASRKLFKEAHTPKKLATLTTNQIEKLIYPAGFYKTKARSIKEISRQLYEEYNSKVPDEIDELLKFKGVGRKTANLVVVEGYNKPGICVDTHVHRISNRLGYVKTKNPHETEFALRKKLPQKHWKPYNELLVTWGQNICAPISPWCSKCPIKKFCKQIGVEKNR